MGFVRIGFAALACIALSAYSTAAERTARIAVDGSFSGIPAPFLVAEDRGYFRTDAVDVSLDIASPLPDAIARVATGAADFALADMNALIKYRDQNPGAPVKAVFVVSNKPAYAIVARKSRGIAKPKDLEGKRLGAPPADAAAAQWPLFAKLNEIDPSKVRLEGVAIPVREPMLAAGQVDAVVGLSYMIYPSLKDRGAPVDDLVILAMADYGLHLYGAVIIANTNYASENPEATKAMLRAFLKGLKETIRDPGRAADALLKRVEGAKKELEVERLRTAIRDSILTDEVRAKGLGSVDAERLANAIEQIGLIYPFKNKPSVGEVFDDSFLPPENERKIHSSHRPG